MPVLTDPDQLIRLTGPAYADGLSEMADGVDPVAVARTVFDQDGDMPNGAGLSALFVSWGQFTDHDLSLTRDNSGEIVPVPGLVGPLERSAFDPATGSTDARQQVNEITPEMDASQIYGSTAVRQAELRSFDGGRLRTGDDPTSARGLLPIADGGEEMAGSTAADPLFLAGDLRANENTGLTMLHTLFVREHNHWADRLAGENPDWTDEEIFSAARSIVEAELQTITYRDWLPHLIGDAADRVVVAPDASGQVSIEFSTAGFRFGHSLVSSEIERLDEAGSSVGALSVRDQFFNADTIGAGGIDTILRGQAATMAQELDHRIIDDLNFFLASPGGTVGFSLAALNILRGRDHGLDSYVNIRAAMLGDIDPATLDPGDFSIITADPGVQAELAAAFGTVDQVDLWTGGLAEDAIAGTQLGAIMTAIVADQFARTRVVDDSFLRLDPGLDPAIAAEVAATDLKTIILRNSDIDSLQDDPFLTARRLGADDAGDKVIGAASADLIIDGAGGDNLFGREGADTFVMTADGRADSIKDFAAGTDIIDVSAWGVTSVDQIDVMNQSNGKLVLRFGDEILTLGRSSDPMLIDDLTADCFIFATAEVTGADIAGTDTGERLSGGNFADRITDGGGVDNVFGGEGADIFVLVADGVADSIKDFEAGSDRIDVSAWGIAGLDALDIQNHRSGKAIVRAGDEVLALGDASRPVDAAVLDADDFIFA